MAEASLQNKLDEVAGMLRRGAVDSARVALNELNAEFPGQPEVLRQLAIACLRSGRNDAAERHMREVVRLNPESPMSASDLAHVLLTLERADEALDLLLPHAPAVAHRPGNPESAIFHFNLARAYKSLSRAGEAAESLRITLDIQPGHPAALVMMGDLQKALGDTDAAAGHYREAMRRYPADGSAWWSLSNLKSMDFTGCEFEDLKKQAGASHHGQQRIFFEFALARAYEQREDPDNAFVHYQRGNLEKRKQESWDREGFSRWMGSLRSAMSELKPAPRGASLSSPRPVFLLSLPRSGSTLTEQILAAHSQVTAAGELPWIPRILADESRKRRERNQEAGLTSWAPGLTPQEWAELGADYLRHCQSWYRDTPVFTDKLPGNIPYAGVILAMLPDALIVNIRRDAMDVCWSCYRQLFMSGAGFAYDLEDLAGYWKEHRRHLEFWQEKAPDRILNLDYEALVRQPEKEIRRLLEFLDLPFEPACLRSHESDRTVNTPSASQVRQPINTSGVGHWKKYERHLGGLVAALQASD